MADARDLIFGPEPATLFAGMHDCPVYTTATRRVICGCAPRKCEQREADSTCECDCCGRKVPREQIAMVIAYGIETGACDRCRGQEEDDA